MAALTKGKSSQKLAAADAPSGAVLHAGWLKRAGAGMLSGSYFTRWAVLHADPALVFYEDEACTRPKGTVFLQRGATCAESAANPTDLATASMSSPSRVGVPLARFTIANAGSRSTPPAVSAVSPRTAADINPDTTSSTWR